MYKVGEATSLKMQSYSMTENVFKIPTTVRKVNHENTSRAYYRPILRSTIECENYTKLYFDAKHLEKGLNRGGEGRGGVKFLVPFFQKKCPF